MIIEFVYFNNPVNIQHGGALKRHHVLSHDTFELEIEGNRLIVTKDKRVTLVPMHNISSVVCMPIDDVAINE